MSFFGKKKPWDYDSDIEKIQSMYNDYPEDKKVLKKVLRQDPSIDVKSVALLCLITVEDDLSFNPFILIKYMTDLGLSSEDASKVIISIAQHMESMENQ